MTLDEKLKYLEEYYHEMRKRVIMGHYSYGADEFMKDYDYKKERNEELFDASVYPFLDWLRGKIK